MLPTQAYRPG
jgi:pescadillo protein